MFTIQLLTAGLVLGCPPSEETTVKPAPEQEVTLTLRNPDGRTLQRRALRANGKSRLVSMEDQGDGVTVLSGDGDDDAFIVSAKSAGAIPVGGPWLGLQFGPPAKPMRVQLGIEDGHGQLVLNIMEGSPADTAGLQQYDVITSIDGRSVPSELDKFIDLIKTFVPGESRSVTYIRGGKPATTSFTIGARPEQVDAGKYKYEMEEEALSQNQVSNYGRIVEKDKDGNWVMRDLGQLDNLPDLWKLMPQGNAYTFTVPGGAKENIVIQKSINGTTLKVERKDGGEIVVSRTTEENGNTNTSVKTYADDQALESGDPEAHKMLKGSRADLGQMGRDPMLMFRNRMNLSQMDQKSLQDLMKQQEGLAKQYQEQAEQWRKQAESARPHLRPGAMTWSTTRARTSFELQSDGSVRVTTRNGDQELVEQYKNLDEMKSHRPELYRKYEKLQTRSSGK